MNHGLIPQNQGNLLTSPGKSTVTGKMKTVESKTLDSAIAEVFYEKTLSFNVAHTEVEVEVIKNFIPCL